jgi:phage host-nuclease inhibitor protein Gam
MTTKSNQDLFVKSVSVPKNPDDLDHLITEVGKLRRQAQKNWNSANERIARIQEQTREKTDPIDSQINMRLKAIASYVDSHKKDLMGPGAKTATFRSGNRVALRFDPLSVLIADEAETLAKLKTLNLTDYIRVTESINRNALKDHPEITVQILDLKFQHTEHLYIKPVRQKPIKTDLHGNRVD